MAKKKEAEIEERIPATVEPEAPAFLYAGTRIPVVTVRAEPDDASPVLAKIDGRGTCLTVTEGPEGWYRLANGLGYLRKEYVKIV